MPQAQDQSSLLELDHRFLVHSLHNPAPHAGRVWVRGEGALLFDADGAKYIDGLAGLWNTTAGHGRAELVEAARAQMARLPYNSGYAGSTNDKAIALAERLSQLTGPGMQHFFFTSGGSESTDSNIKMARYYWKLRGCPDKIKIIARQHGYHGLTLAAMSATGIDDYWPMFEPRMPGFVHIPSPYPYRYVAPDGAPSQGIAAANELEQTIQREGPDTVAMFIAEPVQGSGGVIVPPDDYFPRIREICDEYEVLLVADEVITGFGRTGTMFGLDHWDVQADLIQFAKGITSGYFPLGGIGISDAVAEVMQGGGQPWMHAYTYSGHPVGCAVALAMLDIIENEDFPALAAAKGEYLTRGLRTAIGGHPNVGDIRGLGLMCGVELVADRDAKKSFEATEKVGAQVLSAMLQRGLFTRIRGDTLCLAPAMTIEEALLDEIIAITAEAITAVLGD